MEEKKTVISIRDLKKQYENEEVVTQVLHGLSFDIVAGEFVAIMGPSGSGKSTLMNIIGFLDNPTSGKYFFLGNDVSNLTDDEMAGVRSEKIGFIFQSFNLLPRTTVLENVELPLIYTSAVNKKALAKKALASVGLEHRLLHLSNQLSGGEKQRVAIARALVNNPSIILADEPTGNLDSKTGAQIMEILEDLNKEGHTIILVTHETYTAEHAERIIRLKDGEIVSDKKVENRHSAKNDGFQK